MHDQFMRLDNEIVFKYSSILYHRFLYYQAHKFPITLQKLDTRGNPRYVVFWTSLIHLNDSQYSYTDFIDLFVYPVATMLLGSPPPRISVDIKRILQLSKQYRVGDWYLYQNTEIRIYGCELAPDTVPRYLLQGLVSIQNYSIPLRHGSYLRNNRRKSILISFYIK